MKATIPRGRNWDKMQEEFVYELAETKMASGEMMSLPAITMFYNQEFNGKYENWIKRPSSAVSFRLNKIRARKKDEMLKEKRRLALEKQREDYRKTIEIIKVQEQEMNDKIALESEREDYYNRAKCGKTIEDVDEYSGLTALFFRLYTWSKNRKDRKRMKKELKRQAQEKYRRYVEDLE